MTEADMSTSRQIHPSSPKIDFSTLTLDRIRTFQLGYHVEEDVLFLQPDTPRPATSFDLEGEVWVRVDAETGEVVGLEIEDYEAVFLKRYPEIAQAWAEAKPSFEDVKSGIVQIILKKLKQEGEL